MPSLFNTTKNYREACRQPVLQALLFGFAVSVISLVAMPSEAQAATRLETQRMIYNELQEIRASQQQMMRSGDYSELPNLVNRITTISDMFAQLRANSSPNATFNVGVSGNSSSAVGSAGTDMDEQLHQVEERFEEFNQMYRRYANILPQVDEEVTNTVLTIRRQVEDRLAELPYFAEVGDRAAFREDLQIANSLLDDGMGSLEAFQAQLRPQSGGTRSLAERLQEVDQLIALNDDVFSEGIMFRVRNQYDDVETQLEYLYGLESIASNEVGRELDSAADRMQQLEDLVYDMIQQYPDARTAPGISSSRSDQQFAVPAGSGGVEYSSHFQREIERYNDLQATYNSVQNEVEPDDRRTIERSFSTAESELGTARKIEAQGSEAMARGYIKDADRALDRIERLLASVN